MQITLTDRQAKTVRTALRDMYKSITENGLGDTERGRMSAAGWMEDIQGVLEVMDADTRALPEEMGKRTDDVGRVFVEIPEEELAQIKHERQEFVRELDWLYTQCNITYYPTDGRYPIEHNMRANKCCKPLLDIERRKGDHQCE